MRMLRKMPRSFLTHFHSQTYRGSGNVYDFFTLFVLIMTGNSAFVPFQIKIKVCSFLNFLDLLHLS
uniref:Uncharacterized protein n=1 Tax=Anguilla anguilla TaxID=7936 RepID=A0A0E9TBR9_ANGAN